MPWHKYQEFKVLASFSTFQKLKNKVSKKTHKLIFLVGLYSIPILVSFRTTISVFEIIFHLADLFKHSPELTKNFF
jgi:uncharacterized membrane protein YcfT